MNGLTWIDSEQENKLNDSDNEFDLFHEEIDDVISDNLGSEISNDEFEIEDVGEPDTFNVVELLIYFF